jgi:hypothetical protein
MNAAYRSCSAPAGIRPQGRASSISRDQDGMIYEYSIGVDEIEDEATHRPRQFGFEPTCFCMWGSKPAGMPLPNS